jgi:hypothetical protein
MNLARHAWDMVSRSKLTAGTILTRTDLSTASNPRAFYKKGRVFMTHWTESSGFHQGPVPELARFAVIKPKSTFSVCLRISTDSEVRTGGDYAAIRSVDSTFSPNSRGGITDKDPIEVKVENPAVSIDSLSRINFAKPYTVEHDAKICNIGRVVGASIGLLDQYFAESLGHTRS